MTRRKETNRETLLRKAYAYSISNIHTGIKKTMKYKIDISLY